METANRNASGAGVEMSTADRMAEDLRCSDRLLGASILAVIVATCSPPSSSLDLNPGSFQADNQTHSFPKQRPAALTDATASSLSIASIASSSASIWLTSGTKCAAHAIGDDDLAILVETVDSHALQAIGMVRARPGYTCPWTASLQTALETFTTASKQPLTTGRRPDRAAMCAFEAFE